MKSCITSKVLKAAHGAKSVLSKFVYLAFAIFFIAASNHIDDFVHFRIPVVDIRGDDVSESVEDDDEDLLSFEIEDDTSAVDIYEYDFSSFYDTYNSDSEKKISRKRRR